MPSMWLPTREVVFVTLHLFRMRKPPVCRKIYLRYGTMYSNVESSAGDNVFLCTEALVGWAIQRYSWPRPLGRRVLRPDVHVSKTRLYMRLAPIMWCAIAKWILQSNGKMPKLILYSIALGVIILIKICKYCAPMGTWCTSMPHKGPKWNSIC